MTYRTKRILALVLLLVWMPLYVVAAVTVTGWLERPGIAVEVAIYAALGFLWALPFRGIFRGIGREDIGREDIGREDPEAGRRAGQPSRPDGAGREGRDGG